MIPHNLGYRVLGAPLLWFGLMGFNGRSGLEVDGLTVNAIIVSNIAASSDLIVWTALDTYIVRKNLQFNSQEDRIINKSVM